MPFASACPVVPTAAGPERLKEMAYGHKTEHRLRCRAQIILHVARGHSNARIARETVLHLGSVGACAAGSPTAACRPWPTVTAQGARPASPQCRSPRPRAGLKVTRRDRGGVVAPVVREPAAELTARKITDSISAATASRCRREDALKPWQYRPGSSSRTWTSVPRPSASLICRPDHTKANPSALTSTYSPTTRRP